MVTNSVQEITLTNCGPIKRVSIPLPPGGGIVVLKGRNGVGKSTAISGIETAMTNRGKPQVRDGEVMGEIDACGITLRFGGRTRRTGELLVESIDGKLSISDLIDPGYEDPKACDKTRIKALVQLANVLPSADLFYDLVGGRTEFEKFVSKAALEATDLVSMAERIKRDFEDAARKEEDKASHAEGRARGAKEACEGIDLKAESDSTKLNAALESAIRHETRLKSEQVAAIKGRREAAIARESLESSESGYAGPTVSEAIAAEDRARAAQQLAEEPFRELSAQLVAAEQQQKHAADWLEQKRTEAKKAHAACTVEQSNVDKIEANIRKLEEELRMERQRLEFSQKRLTELGQASDVAAQERDSADIASATADEVVRQVKADLQKAQHANERACEAVATCVAARKQAESHDSTMNKWRQQIEAQCPAEPSAEALVDAAEHVAKCREACEQGVLIRNALEHAQDHEKFIAEAGVHRKAAMRLRDAGKGTDEVLSKLIAGSCDKLRVESGRLVLDTPRRGRTYFHDLSAGERARIALDIALDSLPEGRSGVVPLSQEIFEGLDPSNRDALNAHAKSRDAHIVTGEASDDEEITPEVYEPANA